MSPPIQHQSNEYDNNNGYHQQYFVDDDIPELESDDSVGWLDSTYQPYNGIFSGNTESFWNPNPAEETEDDQQDEQNQDYSDMPELENDQNVIFSDSFMDNVEVNDNILDIGINFDFLVEMN